MRATVWQGVFSFVRGTFSGRDSNGMDVDVQSVIAEMRSGFQALNQRVTELKDDTKEDAQEMHRETKDRLVRIEDQCRMTNGRVSILESEVRGVWQRIKDLTRRKSDDGDGEGKEITLGDLKWYLVCVGGGFGAAIGLLKLMGKL